MNTITATSPITEITSTKQENAIDQILFFGKMALIMAAMILFLVSAYV